MIPCLCLYVGLLISFFRYSFSYLDSIVVPKPNFRLILIFQILKGYFAFLTGKSSHSNKYLI